LPSCHLTQKVVDPQTKQEVVIPRFYEFRAGEPMIVSDAKDFEHLTALTWRVGRHEMPLFRKGQYKQAGALTEKETLQRQVAYLMRQVEQLSEQAGIPLADEEPEIAAAL
jgi:hypothetical protein